jgi:hypothetical protein
MGRHPLSYIYILIHPRVKKTKKGHLAKFARLAQGRVILTRNETQYTLWICCIRFVPDHIMAEHVQLSRYIGMHEQA